MLYHSYSRYEAAYLKNAQKITGKSQPKMQKKIKIDKMYVNRLQIDNFCQIIVFF